MWRDFRVRDVILKVHISLVAALFPLVESLLPLRKLLLMAESPSDWTPYHGMSEDRIIKLIDRRLRRPFLMQRRRCLRQGMLLYHFLRLAGVPATLFIAIVGSAEPGRPLLAHCWVNVSGRDIHPPEGNATVVVTRTYSPFLDSTHTAFNLTRNEPVIR